MGQFRFPCTFTDPKPAKKKKQISGGVPSSTEIPINMLNFTFMAPDVKASRSRPRLRLYGNILTALDCAWEGYRIVVDLSTVEGTAPAAKRACAA